MISKDLQQNKNLIKGGKLVSNKNVMSHRKIKLSQTECSNSIIITMICHLWKLYVIYGNYMSFFVTKKKRKKNQMQNITPFPLVEEVRNYSTN